MGFKTSFLRRRAYLPKGETSCVPSELFELLKSMRKSSEDRRKKENRIKLDTTVATYCDEVDDTFSTVLTEVI